MLALVSCSKVERNEKKYLEAMQSEDFEEANAALDEFTQWLMKDKATMSHDFGLMREKLGMKICTSADGRLRSYSWPTGNNTYANVLQWTVEDNFIGYSGPIDKLLAGRKADIKKSRTMAHSIDTIIDIQLNDKTIYLIAQSYIEESGMRRAYVSASTIMGKLVLLPFFFDGIEIAGNNAFHDQEGAPTPIGALFKWDKATKTFSAYQTDSTDRIIPNQYTRYQLQGDQFKRVEPVVSQENN